MTPEITRLVNEAVRLEAEVEKAEEALSKAKKALGSVIEGLLPQAMIEQGLLTFTLEDGRKITYKETVRASIPKDGKLEAYEWLRQHGLGGVVKHEAVIDLGRDDKQARKIIGQLVKKGFEVEDSMTVNAKTLEKNVREQIEFEEHHPKEKQTFHKVLSGAAPCPINIYVQRGVDIKETKK